MELGEQAYHNSILLSQESWKGFLEELINKLDLKNKKESTKTIRREEYSRLK